MQVNKFETIFLFSSRIHNIIPQIKAQILFGISTVTWNFGNDVVMMHHDGRKTKKIISLYIFQVIKL